MDKKLKFKLDVIWVALVIFLIALCAASELWASSANPGASVEIAAPAYSSALIQDNRLKRK